MDAIDQIFSNLPEEGSVQTIGRLQDIEVSGNNISSGYNDISIRIYSNGKYITDVSYHLPAKATTTIYLKDILQDCFDFAPPVLTTAEQASCQMKEIRLLVDYAQGGAERDISFFLINNKLDDIDVDHYLTSTFLSIQPWSVKTDPYKYEVLTVFNQQYPRHIICRAFNKTEQEDIIYTTAGCGLINIVFYVNQVLTKFSIKDINRIYFFIEDFDSPDEGYGQEFIISRGYGEDRPIFYFESSAGGFERITPMGANKRKAKIKAQLISQHGKTTKYYNEREESRSANSGYLSTEAERIFFNDFLQSNNIYLRDPYSGLLDKVVIVEATADSTDKEICSYTFDYRFCQDIKPLPPRNFEQGGYRDREIPFRIINPSRIPDNSSWMRFVFNKTFASANDYNYYLTKAVSALIDDQNTDKGLSYLEYDAAWASPQNKTTLGMIVVEDLKTKEQATAFVTVPKWMMKLEKSALTITGTYAVMTINFLMLTGGGYDFDAAENYSIWLDPSLKPYLEITRTYSDRFEIERNATPVSSRIQGYIQIYDRESSRNHYLLITLK